MEIGSTFEADYNISNTSKYWTRKIPSLSFKVDRKPVEVDGKPKSVWVVTRLS